MVSLRQAWLRTIQFAPPETMTSLYICYQSVLEPLTQTQVIAYLEGLASAGYDVLLLTFEPRRLSREEVRAWEDRLAAMGITWYWRRYHKRPTLPATGWDILVGIWTGVRLIRRHRVKLVHARAHVPGVMGLALKRLTRVKLLFDIRGLMAEEYADAGVWLNDGLLFRLTKRAERALVHAADGFVVLTRKAEELLRQWYPNVLTQKPVEVIPCCVDLDRIPAPTAIQRESSANGRALVYTGKLGGWYLTEAMAAFAAQANASIPGLRWHIWTQSDPAPLKKALARYGLNGQVTFAQCTPKELPANLTQAHAGLSFIKPCLSKRASSPTKLAEYLAAGLPVVSTTGIGDTDAVLRGDFCNGRPVGVLVSELDEGGYRQAVEQLQQLWADPDSPARCRAVAEAQFDLRRVGWTRYRRLYEALIGLPNSTEPGAGSTEPDSSDC